MERPALPQEPFEESCSTGTVIPHYAQKQGVIDARIIPEHLIVKANADLEPFTEETAFDDQPSFLETATGKIRLHRVFGERVLYAPLQEGHIVGVAGAASCVGVVIATTDRRVAVYHFEPKSDPIREISQYSWPPHSQAVIAGGSRGANSRRTYDWAVQALNDAPNITLVAIANYNEVYYGNLGEGLVGWYLPQDPGAPRCDPKHSSYPGEVPTEQP